MVFQEVAGARRLGDVRALAGLKGGAQGFVVALLPHDFELDIGVLGVEGVDDLLLDGLL